MKTIPYQKAYLILVMVLLTSWVHAQDVLENYVRQGLKNNQVLQQRNIALQQAENALKIARSYFLPSVTLLGDYTSGEGGRSINVPIGDLLNPVYGSLNQLTQSDAFPEVENVSQDFFPYNFYDARVRTTIPLINSDLYINRNIQGQQVLLKQHEVNAYKRQLVFEIKSGYYHYLSAIAAVKIYESGLILVNKNVEVNESLTRNGKGLPANLLRSKSEAEQLKAELNSARNRVANAQKYFNFLLNRDLDSQIEESIPSPAFNAVDTLQQDVSQREELEMIRITKEIDHASLRMNQLSRLPKVNAFLDLGTQATDWQYNNDSRYYLAGIQLTLPLFQGFRNNLNIRQSKLDIQKTTLNMANTEQQLQLSADIARNDLHTAAENLAAADDQVKSAKSYFNLIEKGYQQGVNALIEFLDARDQLTAAALQQNLRSFEVLVAEARLERETANYSLQN
jgi:outer membrane protein